MKTVLTGLLFGFIAGVLDCLVFYASGFPITAVEMVGALSFWPVVGLVIFTSNIPLPAILRGVLLAVVMSLPWAVDFIFKNQLELILPLFIVAIIWGALLGLSQQRQAQRRQVHATS